MRSLLYRTHTQTQMYEALNSAFLRPLLPQRSVVYTRVEHDLPYEASRLLQRRDPADSKLCVRKSRFVIGTVRANYTSAHPRPAAKSREAVLVLSSYLPFRDRDSPFSLLPEMPGVVLSALHRLVSTSSSRTP